METLICKPSQAAFEQAGRILKDGGIVAFPTDTVYGLGAIFTDEDAVRKIFAAKGRDEGKPLSILVSDISQVSMLAKKLPDGAEKLMNAFWPGALTIIVEKNEAVPDIVTAGGKTVGIRMPADESARALIAHAGMPLAAPSANTSGKRSSATAEDVIEDLYGKIDMLIDGGACSLGVASTVLDMSGDEIKILRDGNITKSEIDMVLGKE